MNLGQYVPKKHQDKNAFSKHDHAILMTNKDIIIHKKGAHSLNQLSSNENITVPAPINVQQVEKSEKLSVYTDKKWIPNREDIEDINMKDKPSIAKVIQPNITTNSSFATIIPDVQSNPGNN